MGVPEGIIYKWSGRGFGNNLILATVVRVLNDNGVSAVLYPHRTITGLVDVPMWDAQQHAGYVWADAVTATTQRVKNIDEPFVMQLIRRAERIFNQRIHFDKARHGSAPVTFQEMDVPEYDVAMNTVTSDWGKYRDWPHFAALKGMMELAGISYVDLNEEGIYGHKCLNYVRRAKVYLGMDTGMSHYVSRFANGKALILHGGISVFHVWSFPYDYEPLLENVDCIFRPCFLDRTRLAEGQSCPYGVRCITEIKPERVIGEIGRKLGR